MEKWYERFDDKAFTDYIESGEAAAVHVVRDCADDVNTSGKWIDVISINTFVSKKLPMKTAFNRIIIELFPRIHQPKYTGNRYTDRYLTWHAAHDDIREHHSLNPRGDEYLVLCKLKEVTRIVDGEEEDCVDYCVIDSCKVNNI